MKLLFLTVIILLTIFLFFVVRPVTLGNKLPTNIVPNKVATNYPQTPKITPKPSYKTLDINNIFATSSGEILNENDVHLVATGDVIPARVTDSKMRTLGFDYPFLNLSGVLEDSDITVANLEAPLIDRCPLLLQTMKFCGQIGFAKAMKDHGIDVVTLENNHIGNYGLDSIRRTEKALQNVGLEFVRLGSPLIKKVKNTTFGFVAVNAVGPVVQKEVLAEQIRAIRSSVDVVVVSIHWGREYTHYPLSAPGIAPDDPIALGHFIIDSGADFIIGNHPHWVQGIEQYGDGFISYAHGNFIFDQEWSRKTKEGVLGHYIFSDKKLQSAWYTPVIVEDYSQPRFASDVEGVSILEDMKRSSEDLKRAR
jgi:hypothetical protein